VTDIEPDATPKPPAVDPGDERAHPPGAEQLWSESWYFDFMDEAGTLGGYVRIGILPNLDTCWYWACLVGEGRPLVTVIDHDVPIPRAGSLEIRTEGLWADHTVEVPLDHFTLGLEAFAVGVDDPTATYGDLRGDRVPFGLDLEWDTDGTAYPYPGVTRYEVPAKVHGEILVGDERIEFDGWGQRDHSWGVRDWWSMSWCWSSGRLEDGTRFHGTHVLIGDDTVYATGYVQPSEGSLLGTDQVRASYEADREGIPTEAGAIIGPLQLRIEPVAFAPVLLVAPDGRLTRFPRALCRFEDVATGRRGVGWTEWNQPQDVG
jgi:hypothetical protein